jgi:hypothetical protein
MSYIEWVIFFTGLLWYVAWEFSQAKEGDYDS